MGPRIENTQHPAAWQSKTLWAVNILIVLSAVIMLSAIAVTFISAESVTRKHAPLILAIDQIKIQTTLAHLWFEEAISGDTSVKIEDIQAHIAESQEAAQMILAGGDSSFGKMNALKESPLRDDILKIQTTLAQFKQITEQRWKNIAESGIGSEIDQHYDTVFEEFLDLTDKINRGLQQHITTDSKVFRTVSGLLLGISCLVILATAALVNYFLTHQYKIKQKLFASNQQLQATEQQLRAANQQLQANEQQLRSANQQLTANEAALKSLAKFPSENPHPILRIQNDGTVIYHNCASTILLEQWQCETGTKLPAAWCETIQKTLKDHRPVQDEIQCKDNVFSLNVVPVPENNYVNIYATDITTRKQAEQQLRASRQQLDASNQQLRASNQQLHAADLQLKAANQQLRASEAQLKAYNEELITANQKLTDSEKKYRSLFENMMNGFALHEIVCDQDGRPIDYIFLEVNNAFERLTGLKKQAIIGKPVSEVLPGIKEDAFDWIDCYGKVALTGQEMNLEEHSRLLDKCFSVLAFSPQQGQFATIIEDITDRKKAERERKNFTRLLETKNEELQSIVYVSSHDLKTPLVNISGFGNMLTKHCGQLKNILKDETLSTDANGAMQKLLEEEIPEDIEFITQSAQKMNSLINGLLEVSRVGTASLNMTQLDMNRLIRGIINNTAYKAQELEAEIITDELPPCIGDPSQISQIFMNLIDNSLKYSHASRKPCIRISCTIKNGESVYCVEDNGIGIHPEYHTKIFEIFHRLDPKSETGGEGLGLTIIRRILDRHNGRVWLESTPEQGSRFYISLPNKELL